MSVFLLDGPLLRDQDDHPGFYTSATGVGKWTGGALFKSDDTVNYGLLRTYFTPSIGGVATTTLGSVSEYCSWDKVNTVTVVLNNTATLSSVTPKQVLSGLNIALLGSVNGWELIGFANATEVSPGEYTLSLLRRGLQGTEWMVGAHTSTDQFALMQNDSSVIDAALSLSDTAIQRTYQAYTANANPSTQPVYDFTCNEVRLKPLAPVHPVFARDVTGNLTLAWTPRRRLSSDITDGVDYYIDEVVEAYQIDVVVGGTVKRTISTSSPSLTYAAVDQVTDGNTPGSAVAVKVYQMSNRTGRGYPGSFTG